MLRFRRHMSVVDRRRLREEVMQRELRVAQRRALLYKLSETCTLAMGLILDGQPEKAADVHYQCHEEELGGAGCLCPCHDTSHGGVVSGSIPGP